MAGIKLSENDEQVDYLFNVVFNIVEKVDSLPELEINYNSKGVISDSFQGAAGISGKAKPVTANTKSLENLCSEYKTDLGEVGFTTAGLRIPRIDDSSIAPAQEKLNSIKENYQAVKNCLNFIVESINSGKDDAEYADALAQIQGKTGALEGGRFYWKIPLKAFIQYADALKAVLHDGMEIYGMKELKPIYEELESALKQITKLRIHCLMHPIYEGCVTVKTADKVLKYEARQRGKEPEIASQSIDSQLMEVIPPRKQGGDE